MMGYGDGSWFELGKRSKKPRRQTFVSVLTMRDGRRVSRITHTKEDAKAQLAELRRLRDAGAPITDRIRLGTYLERWLRDVRSQLAPGTWRKHESIVRCHLAPELGHLRLSELRVNDVDAALQRLANRGLHPQSVRHVRATLRRSLADALRDGLVVRNVGGLANPGRLPQTDRTILDATQARRLIEATRDTRYGPLWTILVTTGLRISEALGLTWSAVELGGGDGVLDHERRRPDAASQGPSLTVRTQLARENGEWVRRPPKTAKGRRTIPLTPLGVEALRAQRAQQDGWLGDHPKPIDALVFTSSRGHPLHETNLVKKLAADLEAAGLPRVTIHDLRHTAATLLYSMGVPLETIADMLGHSTPRITAELYRHRVPELQTAAAERMQEALG